ncbi:MAG TPA: site-2 protease family protein [candidate division Zixibacteria bacterium]|nr:site-2 protease family protein [candidate division Zixibacteria bacterium]
MNEYETQQEVIKISFPQLQRKEKITLNLILFVITLFTTTFAGAMMEGAGRKGILWYISGFKFSLPLMLILGIHETGHYLAAKYHNIRATLPYFIPAPTLIGTFGAFIKIKEPIKYRDTLMDVGAAGPLAGFFAALPILFWGVWHSKIVMITKPAVGLRLGGSIILVAVVKAIHGTIPSGYDLQLSAPAFAAWLGLFVTSLNLLPIGQLDGGHIMYALLGGEKADVVSRIVFFTLLPLGIFWPGWIIWAFLLYFVLGLKHPPIIYPSMSLDWRRKFLGWFCIFIFIITFTPVPFG